MKIKLTEDQINQLVKAKEAQIEQKFKSEIDKLTNLMDREILALRKKYENYEISIEQEETKPSKRNPIDENKLIQLYKNNVSVNSIAKQLGASYAGVSVKIKKLGLTREPDQKVTSKPKK